MKNLLLKLHSELKWENLKHQDQDVARLMEIIAPMFVKQSIKLIKAQSVSGRSKK